MLKTITNYFKSEQIDTSNKVIVILLAAILVTQILILLRIPTSPPTIGEVRNAKTNDARTELLQSIPLVRVQGGSIDADVTGTVDVDVQNTPLEVEINH